MEWQNRILEMVPIAELTPYDRNARTHTDEQIQQVKSAISEFGWTNPILIDENKRIMAGHARWEAAKLLELAAVPCIGINDLTEDQKRAYIIADNKLALNAGWDDKILSLELGELRDSGYDLSLTGFNADELGSLLDLNPGDGNQDPDVVPDFRPVPASGPGDLWILGPHRLMCGDARDGAEVARLMDGRKADLIFTDPPYNVNHEGRGKKTSNKIKNDNVEEQEFASMLSQAFQNMAANAKAGAAAYIFHASRTQKTFERALQDAGYEIRNQLIWNKPALVLGWGDYRWKHEPFFYAGKRGQRIMFYGDRKNTTVWDFQKTEAELLNWARRMKKLETEGKTTVWSMKRESYQGYEHPTQKPVELITYALLNSSKSEDLVMDLFGGAGSSMIACQRTNRACYTMELDPRYVDVMIERWQGFVGQAATLGQDGPEYAEVRTQRT